ncbi:DUF7529 family protein [Natronobeatus ordinarius]|uniref:DUF7529 family protein n=1 Tax=Natronobeatus ordinarius TaxID=2963433 RepID=UPI0020CCBD37|nr:hypothetical protein [Natronobeatus ordinarius]
MTDVEEHGAADPWAELLEDAESIAAEYREYGWNALVVPTAETAFVAEGERAGINAFVPEDAYEPVEMAVEHDGSTFDRADVYRRTVEETTYVLAVELDEPTETVVAVPLAYSLEHASAVLETALEEGHLPVHVRPPSVDAWVSFSHADPTLFVDAEELER